MRRLLPGRRGRSRKTGPWAPHWYDAVWTSEGFRAEADRCRCCRRAADIEKEALAIYDASSNVTSERLAYSGDGRDVCGFPSRLL